MYDYSIVTSVNIVRSKILKKMYGENHDLTKEPKVFDQTRQNIYNLNTGAGFRYFMWAFISLKHRSH